MTDGAKLWGGGEELIIDNFGVWRLEEALAGFGFGEGFVGRC